MSAFRVVREKRQGQEVEECGGAKSPKRCLLTEKDICPRFLSALSSSMLSLSSSMLSLSYSSASHQQERQAEWLLRDFDAAGAVPVSVLLNYLRAELAVSFFDFFPSRSTNDKGR